MRIKKRGLLPGEPLLFPAHIHGRTINTITAFQERKTVNGPTGSEWGMNYERTDSEHGCAVPKQPDAGAAL